MTLRAIIFDVDGTLAETEELHRRAFNDCFAAQGLGWHWDQDRYRELLRVTGGKERIARDLADRGIDPAAHDIPALHRAKTARYTALMAGGKIALRPGIAALIASARAGGLRLAIATTTSRPNIDALVRATMGRDAAEVFDVIAAGDEVAAKKPAPDVYLLALERLGIPASDAVALEDSLNGLLSARAAGLRCVVSPATYTLGDAFPDDCPIVEDFTHVSTPEALKTLLKEPA
ncbi:MAG TPA: HAD family hydrolase [Paracoccus sp.]|nr:HAD family hydrolase [Paracoccus sp. (in: a-proteobacteria)]